MKNFINKLRKQPEHVRKIILWLIVIIVGFILAIWWIRSSYLRIKRFQTEEFIEERWIKNIEQQLE